MLESISHEHTKIVYDADPLPLVDIPATELEQRDPSKAISRHLRVLRAAMSSTSERGEQVRGACRLASIAATTCEFGLSVAVAFSVIEGLMLDPDATNSVTARLKEAVAHALGTSAEDRVLLREQVDKLYRRRCQFVHHGNEQEDAESRPKALKLMNRVLAHELRLVANGAPATSPTAN